MSIVVMIILGALVGYIASMIFGRREGFIGSVIIGIVGAFIGNFISQLTTGSNNSYMTLSLSGFIWSIIGAVVLVAILNIISHPHHNAA